ncbi:hypothetical protein BDV06DRAFT_190511 [Aspergillus oleicola]
MVTTTQSASSAPTAPELTAIKPLLDKTHPPIRVNFPDEKNYILGQIGAHNVPIGPVPTEDFRQVSAEHATTVLALDFPNLKFGLLISLAGGFPDLRNEGKRDIRLGDIMGLLGL